MHRSRFLRRTFAVVTALVLALASIALADTYTGTAADDKFLGTLGPDVMYGYGGNDSLFSDSGDDRLFGGDGDDTLRAGNDHDTGDGGAGNDTLFMGSGDDKVDGGPGNDFVDGEEGDDVIVDLSGRDKAVGVGGNDQINVRDGAPDDQVDCGAGTDSVVSDPGDVVAANCETNDTGTPPVPAPPPAPAPVPAPRPAPAPVPAPGGGAPTARTWVGQTGQRQPIIFAINLAAGPRMTVSALSVDLRCRRTGAGSPGRSAFTYTFRESRLTFDLDTRAHFQPLFRRSRRIAGRRLPGTIVLRGDARAQDVTGTVTVRFEQRARSGQILKCSAKTPFRATPGSPQAQPGGELTDG